MQKETMNLTDHYNRLYHDALKKIHANAYQTDPLLDDPADNRRGLSLIIRPEDGVKNNLSEVMHELQLVEPQQYYYPQSDMHITVLSIISCYSGFDTSLISEKAYIAIVQDCLKDIKPFEIEFRGITASPSCLMIQGFTKNEALHQLRENLRTKLKASPLQQSIDKRYAISTAHSTVVRFRAELMNKPSFINTIEKYRNHNFGTFTVDTLELVYNDWYQRKNQVEKLYRFVL